MSTRFIDSFDTVRYAHGVDISERKMHAQLDVMLSLLFGDRIVIPEIYGLDSVGFLDIAAEILDARPRVRRKTSVWNPFILALRRDLPGHSSYREMMSILLKQENFILSAWPEITNNKREREQLADYIVSGSYKEAVKHFDAVKISHIEMLERYFSEDNLSDATQSELSLSKYADLLLRSDETKFSPELEDGVMALKEAVKTLKKAGINLDSRSEIYRKSPNHLDTNSCIAIQRYIDSCYNHIIADSIEAEAGTFTTGIDAESRQYALTGEELSLYCHALMNNDDLHGRLSLWITQDEGLRRQLAPVLGDWKKIWELVTSPEWLKSVERLHGTLRTPSDNQRISVEDALDAHVTLLARELSPLLITSKNKSVTVTGTIGGAVGATVAVNVLNIFEYQFGLSVPSPIGTSLGAATGTAINLSRMKLQAKGSIWKNLRRNVEPVELYLPFCGDAGT